MEDDCRTTDDVIFYKLMEIAVGSVESDEVGLRRKICEEIEQCQPGNAYAILEHVNITVAVESELF